MTDRRIHEMNIMLAVDGSEHSEASAKLLSDLPLKQESSIAVVAVLVPRDASNHAVLEQALEDTEQLLGDVKPMV